MDIKTAAELLPGETGIVQNVSNGRLRDLGLIEGTQMMCLMQSPFGDPVAYAVRGVVYALRNKDAGTICLRQTEEAEA